MVNLGIHKKAKIFSGQNDCYSVTEVSFFFRAILMLGWDVFFKILTSGCKRSLFFIVLSPRRLQGVWVIGWQYLSKYSFKSLVKDAQWCLPFEKSPQSVLYKWMMSHPICFSKDRPYIKQFYSINNLAERVTKNFGEGFTTDRSCAPPWVVKLMDFEVGMRRIFFPLLSPWMKIVF